MSDDLASQPFWFNRMVEYWTMPTDIEAVVDGALVGGQGVLRRFSQHATVTVDAHGQVSPITAGGIAKQGRRPDIGKGVGWGRPWCVRPAPEGVMQGYPPCQDLDPIGGWSPPSVSP